VPLFSPDVQPHQANVPVRARKGVRRLVARAVAHEDDHFSLSRQNGIERNQTFSKLGLCRSREDSDQDGHGCVRGVRDGVRMQSGGLFLNGGDL
jgi:hypothetical protein